MTKDRAVLLGITVLCLIAAIVVFAVNKKPAEQKDGTAAENVQVSEEAAQDEPEELVIPLADVSGTASFYPVNVDGTDMEVLAVKASDGTVRTAFNTCQSCYTSGHGYYKTEGSDLVCQNCGFHFTADEVGVGTGGCSPWTISADQREQTDDEIIIPYELLRDSKGIFENWSK